MYHRWGDFTAEIYIPAVESGERKAEIGCRQAGSSSGLSPCGQMAISPHARALSASPLSDLSDKATSHIGVGPTLMALF